ncbi:hypothetical protein CES86_2950 [Brucella lupini]|uniref:Uncharacterized protein n=1 Tax=Brucella lupini TaxID=255457 RepID=A0A256GMD2_9HYPH|nr:hypothetical protein CES86_2950 [Brucella lupini]
MTQSGHRQNAGLSHDYEQEFTCHNHNYFVSVPDPKVAMPCCKWHFSALPVLMYF